MDDIERILEEFQSTFFMGNAVEAKEIARDKLEYLLEKTQANVTRGKMRNIRGLCKCGHKIHWRRIEYQCSRCSCREYRPKP